MGSRREGVILEIWKLIDSNRHTPRLIVLPTKPVTLIYVDKDDRLKFVTLKYIKPDKIPPGVYTDSRQIAAVILKAYSKTSNLDLERGEILVRSILESDVHNADKDHALNIVRDAVKKRGRGRFLHYG